MLFIQLKNEWLNLSNINYVFQSPGSLQIHFMFDEPNNVKYFGNDDAKIILKAIEQFSFKSPE